MISNIKVVGWSLDGFDCKMYVFEFEQVHQWKSFSLASQNLE